MLESLGDNFLLGFLVILFLLLHVHCLYDSLDLGSDLLESLVSSSELFLAELSRVLEPLQVSESVADWHHCFLLLSEQVTSSECLTLAQKLCRLGPQELHESRFASLFLDHSYYL